ncbi:HPr family phosphocarrier protein [Cellulosilyticum sp. I15G10I2]|uniref:HPr family phosphocarrier protein n=1 Tax=Cellulosilyticum sp. I15G10I2 TaxID=1892843 RepID=UPI00085C7217|nr:HPr family phosphocarrier protein [Cellulosilyticum sp. I15G10I2]
MIHFTVKVPFKEGLHARPAAELVNVCKTSVSDITLAKDEFEINPKSILGILTLAAGHGNELKVAVNGEDEELMAQKIKEFFA